MCWRSLPIPAPTHRTPATLPWTYSLITPLISSYSFERNFSIRSIRYTSFFMSSSTDCRSVSPERHTPHAKTPINKNAHPIAHHQIHLFVFVIIILLSVTEEYTPPQKSPTLTR